MAERRSGGGAFDRPRGAGRRTAALAVAAALAASPGSARTAQEPTGRANYRIDARYEEAERQLVGKLTVEWSNGSDRPASDAWFHLYWNAFANDRSTHLRAAEGVLRERDLDDEGGWQRVTSVRVGQTELLATLRYRQPDDGNAQDRTVFSVDLPQPVQPGESVAIDVQWTARVPRVRRRTGVKGEFLFMAQWFPKLGVFEGDAGWNCHQFHANTEFFSNFGTYDVTLDLPAKYHNKIGTSGALVPPQEVEGDRVRATFKAPSFRDRSERDARGKPLLVHDFAWTADPRYKVRRKTFQYDLWARRFDREVETVRKILGPRPDLPLPSVVVELLLHPEREDQLERHFEATSAALFFYGLWFGAYPYEQITVVDPAWGASEAGGMEYPTLFTAGTRLFTTPDMHTPEGVTVHECGHQFWYGLVANNEFESSWLDEGFNSFTDSEVMQLAYGLQRATTSYSGVPWDGVAPTPGPGGGQWADALSARRIDLFGLEIEPLPRSGWVDLWRDQPWLTNVSQFDDARWNDRTRYVADPWRDPVDRPAWTYIDRTSYRVNSYQRPALVLRTLQGLVGREAFLRGMHHYSEQWRFRHPRPEDFFAAFCEGAGVDVRWFLEDTLRGTGTLDYAVDVKQTRRKEPRGWFQGAPGEEFRTTEDAAGGPAVDVDPSAAPADAAPANAAAGTAAPANAAAGTAAPAGAAPATGSSRSKQPWLTRIAVTRRGELRVPLTIELRWADGKTERRQWSREEQARANWLSIELEGNPRLTAVLLDPDKTCWLDLNYLDNQWFEARDSIAPLRWTERAFQRWQQILHFQSGLGG